MKRILPLLLVLGTGSGMAQYAIHWHTIDGGGGTSGIGPYAIAATIGQADAGAPLASENYILTGGFWPAAGTSPPSTAVHYFVDTFNNPDLSPALVDPADAFTLSGGEIVPDGPRNYIRTVASDYHTVDFQAEVIYAMNGGGGSAGFFFGIGAAEPDPAYDDEPLHSLYAVDHAADFDPYQGTQVRALSQSGVPRGFFNWLDLGTRTDGVHALRLTKRGSRLTFEMDHLYDGGTFIPTYSGTLVLADVPFLNSTNSHLFFGTDASPTRILEIRVEALAPGLYAERNGGSVIISWPMSSGKGWRLQSSPHLIAPIPWVEVPEPYAHDGTRYLVTDPATTNARFYRLIR